MFTIYEAIYVQAIDDEEGNLLEDEVEVLEPVLAGGVLAELTILKRIQLEDGRITIVDETPTENSILDKTLYAIQEAGRLRKINYWINSLTYEKLLSDIGQCLVEKRALVRKKKKLLLATPFGEGQARQVSAKYGLKNRLREIILEGAAPDQRELVQLALLYESGLLAMVFTKGERKAASKKIQAMIDSTDSATGLGDALFEIIAVATRDAGRH